MVGGMVPADAAAAKGGKGAVPVYPPDGELREHKTAQLCKGGRRSVRQEEAQPGRLPFDVEGHKKAPAPFRKLKKRVFSIKRAEAVLDNIGRYPSVLFQPGIFHRDANHRQPIIVEKGPARKDRSLQECQYKNWPGSWLPDDGELQPCGRLPDFVLDV